MPDLDPDVVNAVFKAYDVRGIVPDQLDETLARALGPRASPRSTGAATVVVGHDMRPSSPGLAAAFAAGASAAGVDVIDDRAGARPTSSTSPPGASTCPARCSPRATTRRSTTASRCAAPGAVPIGLETGLAEIRDLALAPRRRADAGRRRRAPSRERDLLADYAAYLRALVDLSGIRPLKVVVDAGNGMAGHTVAGGASTLAAAARARAALLRAGRHVPQPRGQPARAGEPRRPAGARSLEHGADIGLAFDGDADRCFVVDEHGDAVSPSAHHRADRGARARQAARRHDHPQPDHLAGGARDRRASTAARRSAPASGTRSSRPRWPRPARSSAASTPATTTSATSGAPTPACSPPCTCSPRSAGTGRPAVRARLATYERYVAPARSTPTVADQAAVIAGGRGGVRRAATASTLDDLDGLTVAHGGLVVQPAPVEHRTAAAAQRRGPRPRDHGPGSATTCSS